MRRDPQSRLLEHLYREAKRAHAPRQAPRFWRDLDAAFWGIWKDLRSVQFRKPLRRPLPADVAALATRQDPYGTLAAYLLVIQTAHDAGARLDEVPLTLP